MKPIQQFLEEQRNDRMGRSAFKKNAPTLAWETVHGKPWTGPLKRWPQPYPKEKPYKDHSVDYDLKIKWLDDLNSIPEIEIRSSCQGHPPKGEWPSFIIFRLNNPNDYNLENIRKKLQDGKNTFCKYEKGNQGQIRICVATLYYANGDDHNKWLKWWESLSDRIKKLIS